MPRQDSELLSCLCESLSIIQEVTIQWHATSLGEVQHEWKPHRRCRTSIGTWSINQVHNHMDPQDNRREEERIQARPEAPLQVNQHHVLFVAGDCTQHSHTLLHLFCHTQSSIVAFPSSRSLPTLTTHNWWLHITTDCLAHMSDDVRLE